MRCSSWRPLPRSRPLRSSPTSPRTTTWSKWPTSPTGWRWLHFSTWSRRAPAWASPVALYPLLQKINAAVALASVVFRTIEAVFYTGAVVNLLSILPLARQLAATPADEQAALHTLADSLLSMREHSTLVAVFAFNFGALMYYSLFYRSRLVPRWLSGWGIAAALLFTTACLLALFSNRPVTGYTLLILPIAVQEMALAIWLLVKGLQPVSRSLAGATGIGREPGPAVSAQPLQASHGATAKPRGFGK